MIYETALQSVITLGIAKTLIGGIFLILFFEHRDRAMMWFAIAFGSDGSRHFVEIFDDTTAKIVLEGMLVTLGTYGLLRGATEPSGRPLGWTWHLVIFGLGLMAMSGPLLGLTYAELATPVGVCMALARARAAWSIHTWGPDGVLKWVAAGCLYAMAAMTLTYPIEARDPVVLAWGYAVMAILVFTLGVSLLLVHYEQARREARESRLRAEAERETSDELREELERSRRLEALGLVAGGLAHDFNNVLSTVRSSVDVAMTDAEANIDEVLSSISDAADRGAYLTQRLLTIARRQPRHLSRVDLIEIVRSEAEFLRRSAGGNRVVRVECPESTRLWTDLDPVQLQQVLLNLVWNARDAGAEQIVVRADEDATDPTRALLEVEDDGPGIPADLEKRVFDPLFTTKGAGGTGLGLASVRTIADDHGWSLSLGSGTLGGALFRLSIPAEVMQLTERLPTPPPRAQNPVELRELRILLVDDDASLNRITQRLLRQQGHHVHATTDPHEALTLLESEALDVVITDLDMPSMSGLSFIERARSRGAKLRFVLTSGHGVESIPVDARVTFLAKPFRSTELAECLDRATRTTDATRPSKE